jgi:PAS domain S-box-containing protein
LDRDGRCTFANAAAVRMLGCVRPDELVGRTLHSLLHRVRGDGFPWPEQGCEICRSFSEGRKWHVSEQTVLRADGTEFRAEYWLSPISRDGNNLGAVLTFLDITERVSLEDQLRQAQKMEAIGQLASGVAHDFNNLLTVISAHAELAKASVPDDHQVLDSLAIMEQAVQQATGVTRSLLTFTRKLRTEKKPLNLCSVVDDTAQILRRTLPASIELVIAARCSPEPWVHADRTQLQQIVLNLALNARDAMPEGGALHITVSPAAAIDGAGTTDGAGPRYARVTVRDTGVGMAPEVRERMFEPFYSTKPRERGTGLGLAAVHGIVDECGGIIEVSSAPGAGTTFSVALPCISPEEPVDSPDGDTAIPRGAGELILFAEDHQQVREVIASSFIARGYEVVQAADGESLLKRFDEHRQRVQLLVLDVDLPNMNGLKCLQRIRASGARTPAIVITGSVGAELGPHADEHTILLPKPFLMPDLARLVRDQLEQARGEKS